jgi:PAS domain S-box-containing protein
LFWLAFENSRNPMLLLDQNRITVAINDAATGAFGRTADEVVGSRGDLFIAPSGWKRIEADWRVVLRVGRHFISQEVVRADGRHVWVEFAAHREVVTGRQLVLIVVLEMRTRPPRAPRDAHTPQTLTPRELEVVTEIALGRRIHEVAESLHIAPATAKAHARNAMSKLGARSQAQLVAMALAQGLLDADAVNRHDQR